MRVTDCADSRGTVYFNDDCQLCIELVDEVLELYADVVRDASEGGERKNIQQTCTPPCTAMRGRGAPTLPRRRGAETRAAQG